MAPIAPKHNIAMGFGAAV